MVPYNRGATGLLNRGEQGGKEASERHDPITNCTRHLNLDLSTRLEGPTLPFTDSFTHVFYSLVVAFFTCASGSTPQDEHQDTGRGRGRYRWNSVTFGSSRSVSWHHALPHKPPQPHCTLQPCRRNRPSSFSASLKPLSASLHPPHPCPKLPSKNILRYRISNHLRLSPVAPRPARRGHPRPFYLLRGLIQRLKLFQKVQHLCLGAAPLPQSHWRLAPLILGFEVGAQRHQHLHLSTD